MSDDDGRYIDKPTHDHDHALMKAEWERGRAETLAHLRVKMAGQLADWGWNDHDIDAVISVIDGDSE